MNAPPSQGRVPSRLRRGFRGGVAGATTGALLFASDMLGAHLAIGDMFISSAGAWLLLFAAAACAALCGGALGALLDGAWPPRWPAPWRWIGARRAWLAASV